MEIVLGKDKWDRNVEPKKIILNTKTLINNHMMIVGGSGSGKTYNLRKIIRELVKDPKNTVHVLDVHGDIDIGDDVTDTIKFSESSFNGLQPLAISADLDYGGVRKKIRSFISMLNRTTRALGSKQEPVLMNLLQDLYAANGFYADVPDSWDIKKEVRKNVNPRNIKRFPTISDLKRFTEYKYKQMYIGTNSKTINKLEIYNKKLKTLQNSFKKQGIDDSDIESLKNEVKDAFNEYIDSIEKGNELDELIKYDSKDVVKSIYEKLEVIESTGIFKDKFPQFDPSKQVKRYDIKSLAKDEQKMFVDVLLENIFLESKLSGIKSEANVYIVIDEAHMFISNEDTHIMNILAKEARKFGIGQILASQSFTHFSDDIIQSTATKIILGIDEMFRAGSAKKLDVEVKRFGYIIPHKTAMIQLKNSGASDNKFWDVVF